MWDLWKRFLSRVVIQTTYKCHSKSIKTTHHLISLSNLRFNPNILTIKVTMISTRFEVDVRKAQTQLMLMNSNPGSKSNNCLITSAICTQRKFYWNNVHRRILVYSCRYLMLLIGGICTYPMKVLWAQENLPHAYCPTSGYSWQPKLRLLS